MLGGSPLGDQEIRHVNGEYRNNSNRSNSSCLDNLNTGYIDIERCGLKK